MSAPSGSGEFILEEKSSQWFTVEDLTEMLFCLLEEKMKARLKNVPSISQPCVKKAKDEV